MQSRAKFTCTSVKKSKGWNGTPPFLYSYEFIAVTATNEVNKSFFASTPTGSLTLGAVRDDLFEPGREYYLDFTLAE
jgi:hypothetical protein